MNKKLLANVLILISLGLSVSSNANAAGKYGSTLRDVYITTSGNGNCINTKFGGSDYILVSSNSFDTYRVTVKVTANTVRNGKQILNQQYTVPPKGQVFIGCRQDAAAYSYAYEIANYQKITP